MSNTRDRPAPSLAQCREAASAVRGARFYRQTIDTVRPRGVTGICRTRLPLPRLLWLAAREDRLVWRSPNEFAVLQPPALPPGAAPAPPHTRWSRLLDRYWDPLVCWGWVLGILVLAFSTVLAAVLLAALEADVAADVLFTVAYGLLAAACVGAVALTALIAIRGFWWLGRAFGGRVHRVDELAREPLIDQNWSILLCHGTESSHAENLMREALRRVRTLASGDRMLLCPEAALTTAEARTAIRDSTLAARVSTMDSGLYLIGADSGPPGPEPVRLPSADPHVPIGGTGLALCVVLGTVAVQADAVADAERAACAGSCAGRPVSYLDAFFWLLERVSVVGQWDAQSVATSQARLFGFLDTVLGLVVYAWIVMAAWRYLRSRTQAVEAVNVALSRTRRDVVLILTAADVESDAVIDAAVTTRPAHRRGLVGDHPVWHLGTIGEATVVLAQSRQGSIGPASMSSLAPELIDHFRPTYVVLTGICYGLREVQHTLGDVLVCTQLRIRDHRKVSDSAGGPVESQRGDRVTLSVALLSRCRLAALEWTGSRVHFGPMLAASLLLDSAVTRAQLVAEEPDAIGGEMEGAAVHGAAARKKVDWVLAKAISDWGMGKTDQAQELAARNAAHFVLHMIRGGMIRGGHEQSGLSRQAEAPDQPTRSAGG